MNLNFGTIDSATRVAYPKSQTSTTTSETRRLAAMAENHKSVEVLFFINTYVLASACAAASRWPWAALHPRYARYSVTRTVYT